MSDVVLICFPLQRLILTAPFHTYVVEYRFIHEHQIMKIRREQLPDTLTRATSPA